MELVLILFNTAAILIQVEAAINNRLSQPQIYIEDGNMYVMPAEHKNLILSANGAGKILFNDHELDNLVSSIRNSSRDLDSIKQAFQSPSGGGGSSSRFSERITQLEQSMNRLGNLETLDGRITALERQVIYPNTTGTGSDDTQETTSPLLPRRLRRLTTRVRNLELKISASRNPCRSGPCSNGGTCLPTAFGAFCLCPDGWEGERCDIDKNECASFSGTDLGCQHGGNCINTPGSYHCQCVSGWIGLHCTIRSGDCSSGSSYELCGHGTCINQHGSGPRPYTCICDQGWKTDGVNAACNVDVDECNGPHPSCSKNPPVACINVPGSFHCGPCPYGYSGNGYQCVDVNECLQDNGGCSVNPMVRCINTVGSRTCGECPPGYVGNGVSCHYVGMCQVNNGGCHPLARCAENPVIGQSYVQCMCPAGYTGTGMGLHGCFPYSSGGGTDVGPSTNPCSSNPCLNNGICRAYGNTFACTCPIGFTGQTCSVISDPCQSSPCQNGGTCRQTGSPGGYICQCGNDFTGINCERQEESCGGMLNGQEGTLSYPHDSGVSYRHNTNCMWKIVTTPGKVLNITFTRFHLEGNLLCEYDWLQINDGRESLSPLIGRFCGEQFPLGGTIVSTHEVLHFWFHSDHSTTGLGFSFNWNSTDAVCGGAIIGQSHGAINSPGYPGNYPHNRDCLWTISASLAKRIQLVFATLQIETHLNCSFDYIEIRDGLDDTGHVLGKYCNSTLPAPIVSSGPHVTVRFHSDESASDIGFHVTFSEIPGIPGCGGVYTESQGAFSSPQHPEPYSHGLDCEYLIRLPSLDERIMLTFLSFELESGVTCRYDYVEIRDGNNPESPLVGRFCERNMPPIIKSSTNSLYVLFRSDASVSFGGFNAKYESICGGIFASPEGLLRSPFHPAAYPKNRDCIYVISQPVNKAIQMNFLDFDIEGTGDNRCYFDYIEIRDGDNENSTLIGHFCGGPTATPETIVSTYNYLWIRFKTDGSVQNRGFMANYSTIDTGCGGILKANHGVLSSPGHPEIYPHGVRCRWVIRGDPGQVIRLNWVSFNLERNLRCRYDAVEIYDNSTLLPNGSSLIGRFCGHDLPPIITSSDHTITIFFESDHSVAHDGFMANYVIINSSKVCGGNYFTEYGVIKSPGFPNNYPNGKSCLWTISVPTGRQIMLNVTDFNLENGTARGCSYDYLEIRNGGHATSPLIGTYCGNNPPPTTIPSFSNTMMLKFFSDSSRTASGFQIFWDGTTTGCGGTMSSPTGSLLSPNYPVSSTMRIECFWTISINKGSAIQFIFVDLDVQRSRDCRREFVEIRDGPKANSPVIGKYCTAESLLAINSTGNSLTIKYVSGYGSNGRGFHANYQTVCVRTLRGHTGVLESPNFPRAYPHHRNCTWQIEAPLGNMLNLSFSHFAVEEPFRNNCRFDFVEISERDKPEISAITSLGKFCGSAIPQMISTTKPIAIINFVSDASRSMNGFRMEWIVNGCGGRIVGSYGVLKSPNYPQPYNHNVICEWEIVTSLGSRVTLHIYDLDLEKSSNCVYDYLKVYGGPDDNSPVLSTLCAKSERTVSLTSHGNTMFVAFRSDITIASKGFYGYIYEESGGCGGYLTAPTGFIYSPNYPNSYDSNDDCSWVIAVDANHVVELTFIEFNVESHINCSYDHVALYDGYGTYDPLLLMACGHTLPEPPTIKSTGNRMFVRFKTDGSNVGTGFKLNYTTGCGARLNAAYGGEISTPSFPHFMYNLNCTWFLTGSQAEDHVSLTFTHLDIQTRVSSDDCGSSYVEVLDGEDLEAPSVGRYCFGRIPPTITSQGNGLVVRMSTSSAFGYGFRATYSIASSACGGTFTSTEGTFTTPNYPNGYAANLECTWTIQASAGNRVALSFRSFQIESSDYCNSDFVEIHENNAAGRLLGHFCGNEIPTNITAEQKLWILFRSDAEGQAPGFMADYSLVHGNELNGSFGRIQSPLYPMTFHTPGTYTWRIFVNESQSIQITFSEFDVGYGGNNLQNSVTIHDGYDETAPILMQQGGQTLPEQTISTGNVVYIVFNKDQYGTQVIFSLSWAEVPTPEVNLTALSSITGCGGRYEIMEGNITTLLSPYYPNFYPLNMRCEWILNTISNHRIKLKVENFDIESHFSCSYDYLEVYDGANGLANYVLNKTMCQRTENGTTIISSGRTMKLIFNSDASVSRQGFNISLSTICGGYIRDLRGRIISPNHPRNYGPSQCEWIIIVRPGRTIQLTFDAFDVYSGGGSQYQSDQLIIRNGGNNESPFLGQGRYCGNTIPNVPESNANLVYLRFTSSTSGGTGFSLTYNEVSLGCGGQIHLTHDANEFVFSSPNYPHMPPPFTECEWVFTAPQNEAVQLDFMLTFQLTSSWPCDREGVELRDGGTRLSPIMSTFCHSMPSTQKASANIMYVRYFTNINEPQPGFKAKASIAKCGGTISGWYGTVSNPGYPETYDENVDCQWTFRGAQSVYLIIDFIELNLGSNTDVQSSMNVTNCTQDWLKITEENITGIEEPRTWTFCGLSGYPSRVETSMNQVHIIFHSDNVRRSDSKFRIRYSSRTAPCGGTISTPTGEIQSIGYPNPYPHYRGCYWQIQAPEGRRIRIEFLDFDLEEPVINADGTKHCPDRVEIYGDYYSSGKMYNGSLCGSRLPAPVESTSNSLTVVFRTDGSVSHRGFKLRYTTDLPSVCGGTLTGMEGTVASSLEQTGTPNTTTAFYCEWFHSGGSNNGTTAVTIRDLQIPPWASTKNPYCTEGSLHIFAGRNRYAGYNTRKYCGVTSNEKMYMPGDSFQIKYEAMHTESKFNISYQVMSCGGILRGPNDTISSPNYPSSYPTNTECIWILQYRYGTQISVTFTALSLDDHQSSEGCDKDYVLIRNGGYSSSPILGKYCGTNMPSTFNSMSNSLWIEFHSDENSDGSRPGFQIQTNRIEHGCGGILHNKRGSIRSPEGTTGGSISNFNRYPNNVECEWIIETVPGYTVNIIFDERFDIEISQDCAHDYLEFYTKSQNEWTSLGRYCGKQLPAPINTTSTSVKVKFHSNDAVDGNGFFLYWYSPCGGIYSDEEGVIRSAHYDRFNHSQHVDSGRYWVWRGWESTYQVAKCDYVIQGTSENDYIVVEFVPPFEVVVSQGFYFSPNDIPQQTCPNVNVSLWEGNSSTPSWGSHRGGIFCGSDLPPAFVGKGAVTISYNYKPAYENFGWKARYSIYRCGGDITEPKAIQSPGHPFTSAPNMNCTWIVRAPVGKVVRFKFEKLELEFGTRCYYDYVKLFNDDHINENEKLGTFCGNMTSNMERIISRSNAMTVQFVTDWSINHSGFMGSIDFTIGEANGCGGTINTTAGTQNIRSPDSDSDGKYDSFLDCHWLVVGPDFQMIELRFSTFTLEGQRSRPGGVRDSNESCPYDYVEVRDGPGPYGDLLGKFCGSSIPPRMTSSTNFLWIKFVSDGSYQFAGFQATVASRPSPCGTQFVLNATATPQVLQSPNYPNNYENNMKCKWTVDGARFNDEVDIRFVDMQIESSQDCSKDRLEIRDIATSYNNPEGIGGPILFNGNRAVDWRFRRLNIDTENLMQNVLYCGSQSPPDFFSIGRSAEIVFITDSTNSASGFKLEYKAAGCNRTFENSQGRFFSPEYPTYAPVYTNCVMMIKANNGSTISLYFNRFELPDSPDCTQSFFEVREANSSGQILAKLCGSSIPNPVFSRTKILWINFVTRLQIARGFDISYTTTAAGVGCGGELFHTGGSFTSPFFPGNYSQNADCKWKIRVPAGLKISLTFTNFMIGSGDCNLDFVELFTLNSHEPTAEPVLFTRFCPTDTPSNYNGETDMAMIRYKSSANNTGNGWRIEFRGRLPT